MMGWDGRMDTGQTVSHSSLTALTTSDVISYREGGRDSNWNSDDSFLYSENVVELLSTVPCLLYFNLFPRITFGKLIKTLVWPGPGLTISTCKS